MNNEPEEQAEEQEEEQPEKPEKIKQNILGEEQGKTKETLCVTLSPDIVEEISWLNRKTGVSKSKLLELSYREPTVFRNLTKLKEIDALREEVERLTVEETEETEAEESEEE